MLELDEIIGAEPRLVKEDKKEAPKGKKEKKKKKADNPETEPVPDNDADTDTPDDAA